MSWNEVMRQVIATLAVIAIVHAVANRAPAVGQLVAGEPVI
jgi:hypothetical protein